MRAKFWLAICALAVAAIWMLRSIAQAQYLPDVPIPAIDPRDAARVRRLSTLYPCPPVVTTARPITAAMVFQPSNSGSYPSPCDSAKRYTYWTRPGGRALTETVPQTIVARPTGTYVYPPDAFGTGDGATEPFYTEALPNHVFAPDATFSPSVVDPEPVDF